MSPLCCVLVLAVPQILTWNIILTVYYNNIKTFPFAIQKTECGASASWTQQRILHSQKLGKRREINFRYPQYKASMSLPQFF